MVAFGTHEHGIGNIGSMTGVTVSMTDGWADDGHVFVLGAVDPEMRLIERLLDDVGANWMVAKHKRRRVYAGNAYDADNPQVVAGRVVAVECGWEDESGDVIHLDHHRPGDRGYGQPPALYFSASSVGQVMHWLSGTLAYHCDYLRLRRLWNRFGREAHLTAAADHCLGAAYRGACPGIDVADFSRWLIRRRARFEKRSVASLESELAASCAVIGQMAVNGLADLRGLPSGTVPEAPQAACMTGIAVLSRVIDRSGRLKVGLLGASAEQVRAFLGGDMVAGLVDRYGDPARGFAGGYVVTRKNGTRCGHAA